MVRIEWLTEAKVDLKNIYDYIALDSKRYSRLQVEKIKNATVILKTQQKIGKTVREIENSNIRELIEGNYRIIYRVVNPKTIHILMIHRGSRDLFRRIKT